MGTKWYTIALKGEENETKGIIAILYDNEEEKTKIDNLFKVVIKQIKSLKGQMSSETNWVSEMLYTLKRNGYNAFEIEIDNYFEVNDTIQ